MELPSDNLFLTPWTAAHGFDFTLFRRRCSRGSRVRPANQIATPPAGERRRGQRLS
jgi:hypothetical protein